VDRNDYFFPVAVMDGATPNGLAGTAFVASPGMMMTCRHVVERPVELAVHDLKTDEFFPVPAPVLDPSERPLDLAVFESPLSRETPPIGFTYSETVRMGSPAWAAGYFTRSPIRYEIEPAFLSGRASSVMTGLQTQHGAAEIVLPFPIIEGFSGTPLMIDQGERAGLAGVCHGSRQQRAVAEEVIEVEEDGQKRSQVTYRVVEFGLAFHVNSVAEFLRRVGIETLNWAGF
jgi:hypothetical protein